MQAKTPTPSLRPSSTISGGVYPDGGFWVPYSHGLENLQWVNIHTVGSVSDGGAIEPGVLPFIVARRGDGSIGVGAGQSSRSTSGSKPSSS